ncbi:flagellar export chaperone FliS [Anaerobacillus sp. MEB173]|uniref:flagellar export chaperone FliS n=1 Tax=Anaerobacillus sp. MEB173 TaxID=3383345 RepID=UPI003F929ACD
MTLFITEEALHKKSPQEITALLYEACMNNLELAITAINEQDLLEANEKLKKAIDILHRLGAGLNYEAGIIADQLDAVYNYMVDKLIQANYNKEITPIEEVLNMLQTITIAWNQAMAKKSDTQPRAIRQKASAYERSVMFER